MRAPESGFTLVEVLIALVLFSMIGLAGFSLLSAIIGVEARTGQRLARLAELQRAMHVLSLDFEQQIADRPIDVEGAKAVVTRHAEGNGLVVVEYGLENKELRRRFAGAGEPAGPGQVLLSDVDALRWEFFGRTAGWVETWPPGGVKTDARPQAIAAVLTVSSAAGGLSGVVRRVVRLPERVAP